LRLGATRLAFGRPFELQPRFDACRVVISFDDDFLGTGPHQTRNARGWSRARRAFQRGEGEAPPLLAEAAPPPAGAMATDRLIASADGVALLLQALSARLGATSSATPSLSARQAQWVEDAASTLDRNHGAGLVLAGAHLDPEAQALALHLNERLDA